VHRHTDGNPLFVVSVLDDLVARQVLAKSGDHWSLTSDISEIDVGIPDNVRRSIERQLDRLEPEERRLLEVASVAGHAFSAAAVAAAVGIPVSDVETILAAFARQHRFVREIGVIEWPNGTIATGFGFLHALYGDVLYRSVPSGRRAELHRRVATCQEDAYGERAPEIAAELARHFEQSRDARKTALYLEHAAENARRRSAYNEARMHFDRVLSLLEMEPPSVDRTEREVRIRIQLGAVLMAMFGFGAARVEAMFSRAHELCHELGDTPRLFPALWGLWLFYWGRGLTHVSHDLARQLLSLAHAQGDDTLLVQAHHAAWATAFSLGDLEGARVAAVEGIRLYETGRDAAMMATYGSHDAGVCARAFAARALALMGRTSEAMNVIEDGVALARTLDHPFTLVQVLTFGAAVAHTCRDVETATTYAKGASMIANEQDFRLMLAWCEAVEGWADVMRGRHDEGLATIERSIAGVRTSGSERFAPYLLACLAEAQLVNGRTEEGARTVREALTTGQRTGETFYEAELHRLAGELTMTARGVAGARDAESAFGRAIDIATKQGAQLLALRATVSLGRLWQHLGRRPDARRLVTETRDTFLGDLTSVDVGEADALMNELGA
jgi:predicted ATPase